MRIKHWKCKICRKPIGTRKMARKHLFDNHIKAGKSEASDFMLEIKDE